MSPQTEQGPVKSSNESRFTGKQHLLSAIVLTALAVKIDEPDHPLMAVFKGHRGFRIVTELYASTPPIYSRDKQRVLMSLDMRDPATRAQAREERDLDTGISWIENWGKGRVFYTNLGHGGSGAGLELENSPVLEHLLLGIRWALGYLKNVDATPKGKPEKN